jgi:hypothetical protein
MLTFTERLGDALSATRAVLRGIPWVYVCYSTTGACCLVCRDPHKLSPGDVSNRLCQAVVLHHVGNLERFKGQDAMSIDQCSGCLVAKVIAPVSNALMDTRHDLATLRTRWRPCATAWAQAVCGLPLLGLGKTALRFCQGLLVCLKAARVGNLFASAQSGKIRQSHINANGALIGWQRHCISLDREACIPLSTRCASEGQGFNRALNWPMQHKPQHPNFRDTQEACLHGKARLLKGEAVIASRSMKTREARLFSRFDTTEKRFIGQVYPLLGILQDLTMHLRQRRTFPLPLGQHRMCLVERQGFLPLFPRLLAMGQRLVVDLTAGVQGLIQQRVLAFRGEKSVLHSCTHERYYLMHCISVQAQTVEVSCLYLLISSWLKPGALRRIR